MPVAYVSGAGANTGTNLSTNTVVVPAPAGIVAGNLLVACVYAAVVDSQDMSILPTGFVPAPGSPSIVNAIGGNMFVYTKTATGSEPTSYTFVHSLQAQLAAVILQFSGTIALDGSCSFKVDHSTSTPATTVANSVPPGSGNTADEWVTVYGGMAGATFSAPVPTASAGASNQTASYQSIFSFFAALSSAAPTGGQSVTQSGSLGFGYTSVSLLLVPGGGPPTVTGTASVALGPLVVAATNTFTAVAGAAAVALGPLAIAVTNTGVPVYIYVGWIPHTNATGQPP